MFFSVSLPEVHAISHEITRDGMSFCLLGMVGLWRIRILILLWCIVGWLRFDNLRMIFWQNTIILPCKLTYPPKDALLSRWFSFSPGGVYEFPGGYSQNQFTSGTKALAPDCYCVCTTQLAVVEQLLHFLASDLFPIYVLEHLLPQRD